MDLASSVTVKLGGESISLTKLNSELDYAYGDSQIYVELGYNGSGEGKNDYGVLGGCTRRAGIC